MARMNGRGRGPAAAAILRMGVVGAGILGAGAASADVTAEQVWADWKAVVGRSGQSLTAGSEELAGGTLTVRDIVVTDELPDGTVTATIAEVVLAEQGDGTVRITPSPEYRVLTRRRPAGSDPIDLEIVLGHSGLELVASGDAERRTYLYRADSMTLMMDELAIEGAMVPADIRLEGSGVSGSTTLLMTDTEFGFEGESTVETASLAAVTETARSGETVSVTADLAGLSWSGTFDAARPAGADPAPDAPPVDAMDFEGTTRIASADLRVATTGAASGETVGFSARVEDLETGASMDVSGMGAEPEFEALVKAGLASRLGLSYGRLTFDFAAEGGAETAAGSGLAESGALVLDISDGRLLYEGRATGTEGRFTGSGLPVPEIAYAVDEAAMRLDGPVVATDAPQDFALLYAVRGLTLSEDLWQMFDPARNLPRDPLTLALELSGQGRWLIDVLNEEAAADISGEEGEIAALSIDTVEISGAGASLTGSGAFTFDNADRTTFEGMPRPEGALDLRIVGASALIDRLVAMGLLPPEQAMGTRMMLGLFARPGEGEDTLTSKIEVNAAGEVLANGQRLR